MKIQDGLLIAVLGVTTMCSIQQPAHNYVAQDLENGIQAFKATEPEIVLHLYQLMKDIHELFTKNGIEYWIDSGTLLGAVRHKGLIPWDKDLDIQIRVEQENDFLALRQQLEQLGYSIIPMPFGYKVYRLFEGLDIFITEVFEERVRYQRSEIWTWWTRRGEHQIYFTLQELYPLKLYTFGEIQIFGPQNPYPWLFTVYGTDCLDIAYYQIMHEENTYSRVPLILSEKHKSPALPTGPLLDRVK